MKKQGNEDRSLNFWAVAIALICSILAITAAMMRGSTILEQNVRTQAESAASPSNEQNLLGGFDNSHDEYNWRQDETPEGAASAPGYNYLRDNWNAAPIAVRQITKKQLQKWAGSNVTVDIALSSDSDFTDFTFSTPLAWFRAIAHNQQQRIRWIEYDVLNNGEHLMQEYRPANQISSDLFVIPYQEAVASYEYAGHRIYFSQQQLDILKKTLRRKLTLADTELGYFGYIQPDGTVDLKRYLQDYGLQPERATLADGSKVLRYHDAVTSFDLTVGHWGVVPCLQPTFFRGSQAQWQPSILSCINGYDTCDYQVKLLGQTIGAETGPLIGIMEAAQGNLIVDDADTLYGKALERAARGAENAQ